MQTNALPSLADVIEMDLAELILSSLDDFYPSVLRAYLKGDVQELHTLIKNCELPLTDPFHRLACARLQLRQCSFSEEFLESLEPKSTQDPALQGELVYVQAMGLEQLKRHQDATLAYSRASRLLEQCGAKRKALRAKLNSIASKSREFPQANFLAEYSALAQEARKLREYGVAATAMINNSRDYQKLGAGQIALRYANRAVAMARKSKGTLTYYLAIAQRADLFIDLNYLIDAKLDFETLSLASFPEVGSIRKVLQAKLESHRPPRIGTLPGLLPTWEERTKDARTKPPRTKDARKRGFGGLTEKLIEALVAGPKDRMELISLLWDDGIPFQAGENRLKNLINRARMRQPGAILLENGKYHLSGSVIKSHRR